MNHLTSASPSLPSPCSDRITPEGTPNGYSFTRTELNAAFELVQDPVDWKNPINMVIPEASLPLVEEAIRYVTGAEVLVWDAHEAGKVRVVSVGYNKKG
jgi:hypothetical protein